MTSLPDFNDIEDSGLRSHNRGAILANIYEMSEKSEDVLMSAIDNYLSRIPKYEHGSAETCMLWHLRQRGYVIVRNN